MDKKPAKPSRRDVIVTAASAAAAALSGGESAAQQKGRPNGWETQIKPEPKERVESLSPYMDVDGDGIVPTDYPNFCFRFPNECKPNEAKTLSQRMKRKEGTEYEMLELRDINARINGLEQRSDRELYGIDEYWTLAVRAGDCEDLALRKRYELIKRGWEPQDLLMTYCTLANGEGHAVLTVRTEKGDYILDNVLPDVELWSWYVQVKGYHFISRQGYIDPNRWFAVRQKHTSGRDGTRP